MQLPQSDPDLPHLADVVPSMLAAMEVPGFGARIDLPTGIGSAGVLLIDGLGAEPLDHHAEPMESALPRISTPVPRCSTCVASVSSGWR